MVENKPGAFGILAIEEMVKAPPDGYTLQVGNPGTNVLTPIIYKDKFKIDYDKEVVMVTRLGEVPLILAATTKDFAPKNYGEFIALAKANPGKVRYASVGVGSTTTTTPRPSRSGPASSSFTSRTRAAARAITNDLLRGDAQVALVNAASSAGVIKGGQLKVLAVMADERLPEYPDAPTLKELGYANGKGLWSALYAPAKTPPDVLETIHKATVAGAQVRAGAGGVQEADDQGGAECLDRGDARPGTSERDGVLEEAHREVKVERPE